MAKFTRDDVDKFHDYSLYIPHRTIYMGSEEASLSEGESGVDAIMAERLIKNLTILEALSSEPITIIMNNIGGDVYHGLAVYDAIKTCKSHITIKVLGHAMSMGSVILQAADVRIMGPNASQMVHYGTLGMDGHTKTVQKWSKQCEKLDHWMEGMYLSKIHEKQPAFSIAKLKKMLDHDTFLSAHESVLLGLADQVLGEDEES